MTTLCPACETRPVMQEAVTCHDRVCRKLWDMARNSTAPGPTNGEKMDQFLKDYRLANWLRMEGPHACSVIQKC